MNKSSESGMCNKGWIYFILMLVFAVIVYREGFVPGNVLFTTDDSLGAIAMKKSMFPHAFFAGWYDITAAGVPMFVPINSTNFLLSALSPVAFMNVIHLFDLFVGSWFFMMFLRLRGIGWMASVLGALAAYWFGSTFFLTYAGHIGKFGAIMFAGIYLYLVERAIRDKSWSFAVLAGAAMAGMFLEQQDSALFFSMVLGPYALFRGWQAFQFKVGAHAKVMVPLLVTAAVIALHSVYSAMSIYRMDIPEETDQKSEQELWDYCTQWSWPPSETIEFIAPGYMGWRSGDQSGPYWGALGRFPQWRPEAGTSGINFKLETFYIGFLPIMFMALGLYSCRGRRREDKDVWQQVMFWSVAGIITFILACGKYTPLYALFFKLPGISSIRNPVKFMQITQFSIGIISAIGLDCWIRQVREKSDKPDARTLRIQSFRKGMLYTAIGLTVFAVLLAVKQSGSVAAFQAEGWQQLSTKIVSTRLVASVHLAIMAWLGFGLLTAGAAGPNVKYSSWKHLGWAVLLIVMADQLLISHRYVSAVKTESLVSKGDLIPDVQQQLGHKRLYLWEQLPQQLAQWRGLYNQWQTILLPNYQIPTVNIISMRIPADLQKFYDVMGRKPLEMWSHMAMGLALVPTDFWAQARNDRMLGGSFEPIAAYGLTQAGGTGYSAYRVSAQQPSQQVLLRNKLPSERFSLVGAWAGGNLDEALAEMARIKPFSKVMVTPSVPDDWSASGNEAVSGTVAVSEYRGGRVALSVDTAQSAVLRVSEYYSPDWKAYIDGVEAEVVRCDGIFMGVYMEASSQPRSVLLEYKPQQATLYAQFAGLGFAFVALITSVFVRKKESE